MRIKFHTVMRLLLQATFGLVVALGLTEAYFRFVPSESSEPDFFKSTMSKAHDQFVEKRIDAHWLSYPLKDKPLERYFFPPHSVYINRDISDTQRLRDVAQAAKFPRSRTWITPNFLRSETEIAASQFTVTTNALGFRDKERQLQKSANTFRILLFGTYPAFGHGVNDNETYAARLEHYLNEQKDGTHYEVWNLGRQGTTAISGLAILESEALQYQPDFILWDFGWVDMFAKSDSTTLARSESRYQALLRATLGATCGDINNRFHNFQLCKRLNRKLHSIINKEQLDGWREVNQRMIALATSNHIPVLLIRHNPVQIKAEHYERLSDPSRNIHWLDTSLAVQKVTPEMIETF